MTTIQGAAATAAAANTNKPVRQSRGSYSKLICLNCRSRKIKCILPVLDENIQPSGSPQPADKACIRCQQQGLECVIDKTILGRPSSKRKPTHDEPHSARTKSLGSEIYSDTIDEEGVSTEAELKEFMLSEVKDELEHVAAKVQRKSRPEDYERFQALIDMYNLMSIVIGRDKKFASASNVALDSSTDPIRLIKGPIVDELDARLVWVQIYFPYVPTIANLLKQNIASSPEVGVPAVSIRALILILTLIALDAKTIEPPPAVLERESITAALSRCGLELMFIPPTHRYTIYALDLIMEYWPTALVAGQNAAAAALKGELYITLMKRLGERLKLEASSKLLRVRLTSSTAPTEEILELVYDSLLWARICYLDTSIGALITKQPAELLEAKTQLEEVATAVCLAFSQYLHLPASAKFFYLRITSLIREMQAYSEIKLHRSDLVFLVAIMHSHARSAQEQRRVCATMLDRHENTPEIQAIKELVAYEVDCIHLAVAQHVTSYTIFSGYVPHDQEPTMEDVLALGDQIIGHLKTAETWDSPQSYVTEDVLSLGIPGYLARFSPTKPAEICHLLRFFLRNAKLSLNGVLWQPPSRELTAGVLYQCKMVTEENAGRMKGWAWLCEDVDTQLLLLEDCARALAAMDITTKEGKPTSLEAGSIFAAASKLIRGLATILGAWNRRCQERQQKLIAAGEVPRQLADATANGLTPSMVVDTETWKAVERAAMREDPARMQNTMAMNFATGSNDDVWNGVAGYGWNEVNFDDWNAWPQVNPLDRWDVLPPGDDVLGNPGNNNHYGYG